MCVRAQLQTLLDFRTHDFSKSTTSAWRKRLENVIFLREISATILLKQIDYSLSISVQYSLSLSTR